MNKKCLYCEKDMIVHEGQIVFFHKKCRKEARKLQREIRRQKKRHEKNE